jgi:metal-responsive CopG/Arc/MetJ family transcriptional regulator
MRLGKRMEACYTPGRKEGITVATIKTAISLPQDLFERAETLANELQISRSHLFGLALEEFLRRHRNQRLLEQINTAYAEAPDPSEQALLRRMRRPHRQMVEGEW